MRRDVEEPLTFVYRPQLFPGMDEALQLGHAVQYHLLPRELPPDTPVNSAGAAGATRLGEGDTLLLFSDGLIELRKDLGEEFGTDRVADVLRRGGRVPEIADNLLRAIENFHDLERLDDDLSLIVLQRRIGMGSSL